MSNELSNTSITLDFTKKSDVNESLLYLKEAFSFCMQDIKNLIEEDLYS